MTLTDDQRVALRGAFDEAMQTSPLPAKEREQLYAALLAQEHFHDIFEDITKPYMSHTDRFGDFVYDPQGVAFDSVKQGGDFLYLKADQRRLHADDRTYRLTGQHVARIVFDNENDCCFITPDGEMLDLEDTNDWYFVIIEEPESALEL